MKTTLTVEVEYNPRKTDPEGLASAMDRLLETALSIPEVMDEYGNPTIGEFFVAKETVATPAPKVVLNMGGGLVQEVFASDPAITVALVDWDTEGCDPSDNGIVEIPDERGGTQLAHVAECAVEPLEQLAGTETEAALKAAGLDLTQPADSNRAVARKIQLPCYGIAATVDRPPLSPAEIEEIYRAILSRTPNDPAKARTGLEAYLAGYNHAMPAST